MKGFYSFELWKNRCRGKRWLYVPEIDFLHGAAWLRLVGCWTARLYVRRNYVVGTVAYAVAGGCIILVR